MSEEIQAIQNLIDETVQEVTVPGASPTPGGGKSTFSVGC